MSRLLWIIVSIALLASLGIWTLGRLCCECASDEGEEVGPYPASWFMQQRLWPDNHIAVEDYLQARHTADALRANTLDDPAWIQAGPTNIGGRVTDIVGHPTNSQLYYVAAASGGIFKTTDGGTTWTSIFDAVPTLSMGAMAIDLAHPDTLYAGTGEANSAGFSYFGSGLYRSTDAGVSWTHLCLTETQFIARVVIDPYNPSSIWVAAMGELFVSNSERGIYHSTDAGTTWDRVLFVNDSTGASDIILNPENTQIVYAAMWQRIRNPEFRRMGGRGSGVFKSTNGGATWSRLVDGLPPIGENVGRIGLALCETNPDILYACYADHPGYFLGVYRSANSGDTWSQVSDNGISDIYSSFGWYFGNIRVRPDNENMVFLLGVDLARSTNGGQSWTTIGDNVHVDHHALWFHPASPVNILNGNDGGVYRSTNNGNAWTFRPGLHINQFYAATVDYQLPQRRYGGTQDNGTLRTTTGSIGDWDHIFGGDGFYALVDPTNSNVIYAESQYGYLGRSTNGGDSWNLILDGIDDNERTNWSTPVAMSPANSQHLYYGAERLYRSTNRGDTWTAISPDLTDGGGGGELIFGTITTIGVSEVNPQVIYAGTDDANFWVTINGGVAWENHSAGLPNRWITRVTPDPVTASVVYVTVSGFRNNEDDAHLFRSTDYGATWQDIGAGLPLGPLNDVVVDPQLPSQLYVASDFGVYITTDLGEHWSALGENLPSVPVIDLVLHTPSHTLTAATYGRSMYSIDLAELAVEAPTLQPDGHLLLNSYPNPFNSQTTISYSIPRSGQVELSVFDITGRHVSTLLEGLTTAGSGTIQWTAQDLPSGTYLLRLTAAGQTQLHKILLLK
jgi:photosystem II stability/assembly factor-like uncharacterized protein